MKRAALALVTALALPAGLPAWESAGGSPVDQRRPAAPDGTVSIENMSGLVKVTGWDKAEVQVKGTLGDDAELAFDGTEKRTRIEVEVEGNPMGTRSDLEVWVPVGSTVDVEGFQATITVSGVTGGVKAETVNGSITQSGAAKGVELQSVNGAIEATKATGRVLLEAVNGTVTVREGSGDLDASTVNGTLHVVGGSFDRASLESVSGDVRFEGALSRKASLDVETVSGKVELLVPAGLAADFSISTFSGEITNALGPAAEKKSRFTPQKELNFSTGTGGARISVQTLSGQIDILKRP